MHEAKDTPNQIECGTYYCALGSPADIDAQEEKNMCCHPAIEGQKEQMECPDNIVKEVTDHWQRQLCNFDDVLRGSDGGDKDVLGI